VAVVAVDPTSPFTGGAILGDRIRMQRHASDAGVFIRSLATRGALGGLSRSARDVVRVLDAWGADVVLVETVGVGQDELEVTRSAHTTLVVMAPGMGRRRAGYQSGHSRMCGRVRREQGRPRRGDTTVRDLELMIALGGETVFGGAHSAGHAPGALDLGKAVVLQAQDKWVPPILKCIATKKEGLGELLSKLELHRAWLETEPGRERHRRRTLSELTGLLRDALAREVVAALSTDVEALADRVSNREIDPYTACELLIQKFKNGQ